MTVPSNTDTIVLECNPRNITRIHWSSGGSIFASGTFEGAVTPGDGALFDTADADFIALEDIVGTSGVTLYYLLGGVFYEEDDLPVGGEWCKEQNPFRLFTLSQATPPNIGPRSVIRYKNFDVGTEALGPTMLIFTGDETELNTLMDDAGWVKAPPTGSGVTYHITVNYWRIDDVTGISASSPVSDNILYSVDDGENWTTAPPADFSTVTTIQTHGVEGWVEQDLIALTSPLDYIGNMPVSGTLPRRFSFDDVTPDFIYGMSLRMENRVSGARVKRGYNVLLQNNFREMLVPPSDIDESNNSAPDGKQFYFFMHADMGMAIVAWTNEAVADFDAGWWWVRCCLESYPLTELALSTLSGTLTLSVDSVAGINNGDTIFINDEEMTVTSVNATADELTVTRGVNDTSPVAHALNDTVRAVVNADAMRYLVILAKESAAPTTLRIVVHVLRHTSEAVA